MSDIRERDVVDRLEQLAAIMYRRDARVSAETLTDAVNEIRELRAEVKRRREFGWTVAESLSRLAAAAHIGFKSPPPAPPVVEAVDEGVVDARKHEAAERSTP